MALSFSLSRSLAAALVLSLALAVSAHDGELKATSVTTGAPPCDVAAIDLSEYAQWAHEEGYWLGEYSLYDADGSPRQSGSDWNYPYAHYRGFITGNVEGNAYRQRNVFMYPPADADGCEDASSVVGAGVCGRNGNTKIFEADQAATTCDPARPGAIEGPYGSLTQTYTTLVGEDNSLLYQVYLTAASLNFYERCVETGVAPVRDSLAFGLTDVPRAPQCRHGQPVRPLRRERRLRLHGGSPDAEPADHAHHGP